MVLAVLGLVVFGGGTAGVILVVWCIFDMFLVVLLLPEKLVLNKGADLRLDMELSFEEAAFGVEKEIEFHLTENCTTCRQWRKTRNKPGHLFTMSG